MSDITMCRGKDCPLKETCRRFKAEPNPHRQSYFVNPPIEQETEKCLHYWREEDK